jgi:hypothetical protein
MTMVKQTEMYKGLEIIIETGEMGKSEALMDHEHGEGGHHGGAELTVDGEKIHVMKTKDNLYASHYLPYTTYPSISDLAKNIVDTVPHFRYKTKTDQNRKSE